jgi:hypothetical protein
MRRIQITIPLLRKKSKAITFQRHEQTLKIIHSGPRDVSFEVSLTTSIEGRNPVKYFSADDEGSIVLNIKNYRSFRIEKQRTGHSATFIAFIF